MDKKKLLILFIIIINKSILFSNNLLFEPLYSYIFEPRIGSVININNDNLRLDIGASFDLIKFSFKNFEIENSFGADFFTYTRLRSEPNFKFPVETSDYFFGINFNSKFNLLEQNFYSRIRISHISSHLVDGYSTNGVFFKMPFIYSREFIELIIAQKYNLQENIVIKPFIGSKYIFSTTPENLKKINYILGLDYIFKLTNMIDLKGGILFSNGETISNISSQNGIQINFLKNVGIFIGYYYYNGNSIHGMFYENEEILNSIGFQIIYK